MIVRRSRTAFTAVSTDVRLPRRHPVRHDEATDRFTGVNAFTGAATASVLGRDCPCCSPEIDPPPPPVPTIGSHPFSHVMIRRETVCGSGYVVDVSHPIRRPRSSNLADSMRIPNYLVLSLKGLNNLTWLNKSQIVISEDP